MKKSHIAVAAAVAMVIGTTAAVTVAAHASTSSGSSAGAANRAKPVRIEVFAPERVGCQKYAYPVSCDNDLCQL